jgi:hypothetical protein
VKTTGLKVFCLLIVGISCADIPAGAAPVIVSFSMPSLTFVAGQTVTVNVLANIPDPVLGFGIDVRVDSAKLSPSGFTTGLLWFPVSGSQQDDVAGIAFPSSISGSGVLLGTASFIALTSGTSGLTAVYDSRNLAEGFLLASGGFAANNLGDEAPVTPSTPEPTAVILIGTGLALFRTRKALGGRARTDARVGAFSK